MPNPAPQTALGGAVFSGFSRIRELPAQGMISLRAKADVAGLGAAIAAATGCDLPPARAVTAKGANRALWMSPDEYLLLVPYEAAPAALAALEAALAGTHHLAVIVSDARAMFAIEGAPNQVLAKLSPTDMARFPMGEVRRSRAAQVAAAFWREEGGAVHLICFRSVAGYVMGILSHAASPGSEIGEIIPELPLTFASKPTT